MALKDQVRKASFKGKFFTPLEVEGEGFARRVIQHEYPQRDLPYAEDLGRQSRVFSFQAFTRWADRLELLRACSSPGPGKLVHPLLGEIDAVCTDCRMRDGNNQAGVTMFTLSFSEVGSNTYPDQAVDTAAATQAGAEEARAALVEAFPEKLAPAAGQPSTQWTVDSTIGWVEDLSAELDRWARAVPGAVDLATFNLTKSALGANAAELVANPSVLGGTISSSIRRLADLTSDPLAAFRMLQQFVAYGASFTARGDTETRRRDGLVTFVRASTLTELSVKTTAIPLDSYNAAAALREEVVDVFEAELASAGDRGDDVTRGLLLGLRTLVLEDLRLRGATLAPVRTIVLGGTVPALVLAYRLYAVPERDGELVARNRIRNPVFMPAGVPLEVLSA